MGSAEPFDAVVIGGGFYGAAIAIYLATRRQFKKILLIEQEDALLTRASYNNQARVHNGYHYPRSFTTAYRSRVNMPRFLRDWPSAVKTDFTKLYAIARRNSKVTARQFERFCRDIGAAIQPAPPGLARLFEPRMVEQAFLVEEFAFDTTALASWATKELAACGVEVRLRTRATSVSRSDDAALRVTLLDQDGTAAEVRGRIVFNCTYSGLNHLSGDPREPGIGLKHEVAEMSLVELPAALRGLGITLMDGPFFSVMPFPARQLHTLSHVRYTPHTHWIDRPGSDPYERLRRYPRASRADRMIRDAARYLPVLSQARPVDSLFEVKTVLLKNENDDGRPIHLQQSKHLPGLYSILGGKLDNIYDIIEILDHERLG